MRSFLLALLACLSLAGCSPSGDLPPIADPVQLSKDCDDLVKTTTTSGIPADAWPASVKSLNPQNVRKEGADIYITTYAVTGGGSHGYIVSRQKPPGSEHIIVSPTSYADIYRFDFKP